MKKTLTLLTFSFAFTWITAQCTVPNASFENTTQLNLGLTTVTHPVDYNPFLSAFLSIFAGGAPGVDSTLDAQSGNLALELFKDSLAGYPIGGDVIMAMPCNGFVSSVNGFYKMSNAINDTANIIMFATAYNSSTQTRDTVGVGGIEFTTNTRGYTSFSFNPIYPSLNVTPDSINFWAFYFPNSDVTSFKLDNLSFNYLPVSLDENAKEAFQLYPNPATNQLQLVAPNSVGEVIQIMNLKGQLKKEFILNRKQEIIDVSNLAPSVYFLRMGNRTEKLVIQR